MLPPLRTLATPSARVACAALALLACARAPGGNGVPAAPAAPAAHQRVDALVDRYYAAYADAAENTPAATDRFLALYDDSVRFEDPTFRVSTAGKEEFRVRVVEPNLRGQRIENVRFRLDRRASGGEWAVVEGSLSATVNGAPITRRFTTWLRFRDGRIAHQIDYFTR